MRELATQLDDDRTQLLRTVRSVSDDGGQPGRWLENPEAMWQHYAALGLLGVATDLQLGGGGGSVVDAGVVALGLGESSAELPYAETVAAGVGLSGLSMPVAKRVVEGCCAGSVRLIPVWLRGAEIRTLGGARLAQVITGPVVRTLTYEERDGKPVLGVIEDSALGPEVRTVARGTYRIVGVDGERGAVTMLVEGADAARRWDIITSLYRLLVAMELTGGARWMLQTADDYSRVREQFGHPIGSYQGLQHVLVDILATVEAAEMLVFEALEAWDDTDARVDVASVAVAFVRSRIHEVMRDCYGVLAGVGFMEEHSVSKYTRTMLLRLTELGTTTELNELAGSRIRRMQWAS